jgi:hypothetical protein
MSEGQRGGAHALNASCDHTRGVVLGDTLHAGDNRLHARSARGDDLERGGFAGEPRLYKADPRNILCSTPSKQLPRIT